MRIPAELELEKTSLSSPEDDQDPEDQKPRLALDKDPEVWEPRQAPDKVGLEEVVQLEPQKQQR